jgi:NitT/TauT family transport system substrate-binding protein
MTSGEALFASPCQKEESMKKVKCLFIIGLSICILALTGCESKPAQKEPIRIAINVWPGYAQAYLAQEKGLFEKNNVEVELILEKSITESSGLFTNGEVDGCFGVFADTIMMNTKGAPAKGVCIMDYSDTGDVIIGKPEIQSLDGLAGKTVSFEGVNSFSHIFVLSALEKAGVHESDVRFENINASDVLAALEENRIDAGHTWEPTKSQALKKGYKILATTGDYPGIITDVLVFTPKIIEEKPDEIRAIVKSLFEAQDYLKEHRDEAVKIMADKMGMSTEEMAAGLEGVYQPNLKENLELLTASLYTTGEMIVDFYLKRGQLSHTVEMKDIIEPKFITELANK